MYGFCSMVVVGGIFLSKLTVIASEKPLHFPTDFYLETVQVSDSELNQKRQTEAEELLERAQKLHEQGIRLQREGLTAEDLRRAYLSIDVAESTYQKVISLWQAIGNVEKEARTLLAIARFYDELGDKQKALISYNRALPLWQGMKNTQQIAETLHKIGSIYNYFGEREKALSFYERSLIKWQSSSLYKDNSTVENQRRGEATTLNSIGNFYASSGDLKTALTYYHQALVIWKTLKNREGEAETFEQIAAVYLASGELQNAQDLYNKALLIWQENNYRSREVYNLVNTAAVYYELENYSKALETTEQALHRSLEIGNQFREQYSLGERIGLGVGVEILSSLLGLNEETQRRVHETIGSNLRVKGHFNLLGFLFNNERLLVPTELDQEGWQKALQLSLYLRKSSNRSELAFMKANLGRIYKKLYKIQDAFNSYCLALGLLNSNYLEASCLDSFSSEVLNSPKLRANFINSFIDPRLYAEISYQVALLQYQQGNSNQALVSIENTLTIIEALRYEIASPELRSSYFSSVQDYYEFYIDLLMQLHQENPSSGYDAMALYVSERARSRTLLELLREAKVNVRQGIDPQLIEQEHHVLRQLDAVEHRRIELLGILQQIREQPAQSITEKVTSLEQEREVLLEQYQTIQAQIRAISPSYTTLTQPQPLTLAEIQQQVLDEDTVLLEYSIREERSYLWVITQTDFTTYLLPGKEDIQTAVRNFNIKLYLKDPIDQIAKKASDLSELVLQPAADKIQQKKRLLIVADGALQYVPFSALTLKTMGGSNGYEPLILHHEVVHSPSASTISIIRQETANRQLASKTIAILADPVFSPDDQRVSFGEPVTPPEDLQLTEQEVFRGARDVGINWNRLPGTRQEAETILGLVSQNNSTYAFDFQASRNWLNNSELSNYQIIHLATHGFVNTENPALSGLVLSLVDKQGNWQNGYLRLHDIFNLNLPAELIVLSACQTALGQNIKGEGLVGITRGFIYAGTPRILASLWRVDDQGTAVLMSKFYTKMLQEKSSPVEALRFAQLEMWQDQNNPMLRSPHYWSAFILQGEWK